MPHSGFLHTDSGPLEWSCQANGRRQPAEYRDARTGARRPKVHGSGQSHDHPANSAVRRARCSGLVTAWRSSIPEDGALDSRQRGRTAAHAAAHRHGVVSVGRIQNRRDGLSSRRRPCVACASVRQSHATWSSSRVVECGASGLGWEPPPPPTAQSRLPRRRPVRYWPGRRPSRGSSVCICGPNRMGRARCAPVVQSSEQSWNECTSFEARVPVAHS